MRTIKLALILTMILSGSAFAQNASLITPSAIKSRSSGVAPLAIHFDATATTAVSLTSRPFHDLEFRWNFGDEQTSTWAHGAQPGVLLKNEAFGPVAAHVYETAGTFNPTLQVRYRRADGTFEVQNFDCGAVTVTAADTEWAGAKTICVSSSGNFTGAPAGSILVTSSSANAAISASIGSGNVRILFRAGETFTASSSIRIAQPGPSMIGSFGVGAKPNIMASLSGNAPIFTISSESTPTGVSDWRFQDLSCNGGSTGAIVFFGDGHSSRMLMHRVETNNTQGGLTLSGSQLSIYNTSVPFRHAMWDEFYIVNSTLGTLFQTNGNGVFGNCTRMVAIGNLVDTGGLGEHGIRMQLAQKSVFSNNTFQGIAPSRHHLTIRGVNFNGGNTVLPGTYSELNVVSDNRFTGGTNAQTLTMTSQFAAANERGRNCIVERNWFEVSSTTVTSIRMAFTDVTIRNNVANILHNSGGSFVGAQDTSVAGEHYPDRVNVYNNSVYHASTGSQFYSLFSASPDGSNLNGAVFDVRNNILYAPTALNVRMTFNSSAATINSSNNTTSFTTSPLFGANPPTALVHFTPGSGSYAITGGTALSICSDFYRIITPISPHMGAVGIYAGTSYTVTFDANGGSAPSPANKSVTYNATYGALATTSRSGHTFNGWFTAASGGTQVTSETPVAIIAAQTLYAQWTSGSTFINWMSGFSGLAGLTAFNDDADGDGITNGIEAFFGTAPNAPSAGLSVIALSGNLLTFNHPEAAIPLTDVTGSYEWSLNLSTWNGSGSAINGTIVTIGAARNTPVTGTTTVTATVTGTQPSRVFMRAVATQN